MVFAAPVITIKSQSEREKHYASNLGPDNHHAHRVPIAKEDRASIGAPDSEWPDLGHG